MQVYCAQMLVKLLIVFYMLVVHILRQGFSPPQKSRSVVEGRQSEESIIENHQKHQI